MPTRSNDTRRADARQLLDEFAQRFESLLTPLVDAEAMTHGAAECIKMLPYTPRPEAPPAKSAKSAASVKSAAPAASQPAGPIKPAAPAPDDAWSDDDDILPEYLERHMAITRLQSFVLAAARATQRALVEHDRILGDLAAARARLRYAPEPPRSPGRGDPADNGGSGDDGSGNGRPH